MYKPDVIDFAYLKGDGSIAGLRQALEAVRAGRPRGFCVNPVVVDLMARHDDILNAFLPVSDRSETPSLRQLGVLRQFVLDFPMGQGGKTAKQSVAEALLRPLEIADEFDVVANIGALIADDFTTFEDELRAVIALGKPVKVIVETGHYAQSDDILTRAVDWCARVGADAIKTSTGFLQNIENDTKRRHVALWRARITTQGYAIHIKDAGGKKTREDIDLSIAAGADIIGSGSVID